MNPTVGVVILAYGDEPLLETVVDAVRASTGIVTDIVVVDNGCTSDAVNRVKDRARVVRPADNTGFTGGCAIGADEATGDYIALVNSDAVVAPDALAKLAAAAAEPATGAAMASVRLASDPTTINTAGNPLHIAGLSWAGGYGDPAGAHATRHPVPSLSGCCMVIDRALWNRLGGFAREYFLYHEDTELSIRLWQTGYAPAYIPDAAVTHHYEFSRNDTKFYLVERNRVITVLTTYEITTLLLLSPVLLLTEVAMTVSAISGGWLRPKARGWWWVLRNQRWVRARRRLIQSQRVHSDRQLARLYTAVFDPKNIDAPAGLAAYNRLVQAWWKLISREL